MTYAYIIAGAVAGAPLRYFIASQLNGDRGTFPAGTLLVNLTGCFAIGVLLGLAEERDFLTREARLLLVTGFLGSYTTFSAFGWEAYDLGRADEALRAAAYVVVSVVVGIAATWAGAAITKLA